MFRGPNASGVVEETKLPVEFSAEKNLVWKTEYDGALLFCAAVSGLASEPTPPRGLGAGGLHRRGFCSLGVTLPRGALFCELGLHHS